MAEISQFSVVSFIYSFAIITIQNPTGEWKWSVCPSLCPPLKTGRGTAAGGVGRKACYALFWQEVAGGFYDSGINYICLGFLGQKLISAVSNQNLDTITYL